MINKQSLWFLTLFSLILVLSVYYITMPNELLLTNNNQYNEKTDKVDKSDNNAKVTVEESEILVAMRVSLEEERMNLMTDLKEQLTNSESTVEEKNNAYEQLRYLNQIKGSEEKLESKIKKDFNLDSFIKIDNNQIKVVVVAKEHNNQLANNIMRSIQEEFQEKVYITVKFEK